MVPVAKRNPTMTPAKDERGQISIFFSASLVVMITIVAFTINVGLFVKAKINLQNATDAAAFSGAAVQARQLTKIAYLNWEMRNIYKEWMYKYYVIGNLNIQNVENPATVTGNVMKFNLLEDRNPLTGSVTKDPFNIPAVCIHIAGSKTNICKRYSIPGLPEFGSSNLPGAEEASRAFMDTLIATKVNDCVDRTRLNMLVANTWTYNVLSTNMDQSLAGRGPAILADRQGAWPKAVEVAIRIRNLEKIMNRQALEGKVCHSGSTSAALTGCTRGISDIMEERQLGNERIVKAFYSGYRNLGNDQDSEMKTSFTLTEIPPTPVKNDNPTNASNLLVPRVYEKQWVDLKLMMVNYAIFYAAMIPRADTKTSGACDVSKVAIPVPGYPMGFYKDPDVVTYYAVRGEAEFTGMFNPFKEDAVKMTAYAAAKPFGGRIGPMLFVQKPNQDYFVGRTDSAKYRSVPYITSYNFNGAQLRAGEVYSSAVDLFRPGLPLPANSKQNPGSFWLETPNSPLGGLIADPSAIQFGVPNLVYEYDAPWTTAGYTTAEEQINRISSDDPSTEKAVGLFSKSQFAKFRGNDLTASIGPQALDQEIARVRAPTQYEAANYLIPSPYKFNVVNGLDSFGFFSGEEEPLDNGILRYTTDIYAPLYRANDQNDVLFNTPQEVVAAIHDFMRAQESGMIKYKMALNKAAYNVWSQKGKVAGGAVNSGPGYERAARGISDINFSGPENLTQNPATCNSIAGQFLSFYYESVLPGQTPASQAGCPKSLGVLIQEYFAGSADDGAFDPTYYRMKLSWPKDAGHKYLSGYTPGPHTGVGQDGTWNNPIAGSDIPPDVMRRNFYSTKLIPLDSVQASGGYNQNAANFVIYSEGSPNQSASDSAQRNFRNILNPTAVDADLSTIKY